MTIHILQAVALVAHGNAFLQKNQDLTNFYPNHSTFIYDNKVEFFQIDLKEESRDEKIASSPTDWLSQLKQNGCKELQLLYEASGGVRVGKQTLPDRMFAGMVGGGGIWIIRAIFKDYLNEWYWSEKVTDEDALNKKIWSVSYGSSLEKLPLDPVNFGDSTNNKKSLAKILAEIRSFASNQEGLDNWVMIFDYSIRILENQVKIPDDITEIFPINFCNEQSLRLFAAANSSWVFGCMGSWNDLEFDQPEIQGQYEKLSQDLFEVIINCIVSVVNVPK